VRTLAASAIVPPCRFYVSVRGPQYGVFLFPAWTERIIRPAMIDKAHLRDKRVAFRISGTARVHLGTVTYVETDGFWILAPDLLAEAKTYGAPAELDRMQTPVIFVPTVALQFLVAATG
jgi:hypothetical protein